ncbi:SgcJ/EcaC family oxidoreductase [[Mycobacterium] wendilense]|uniref:SgcJ/EcaC family oxidoreductase n=1 Tax=[Mycobacterium] wendilense TaxID=3064284 RepID=A0ABN9P1L7_9MYCO|nr:SgcJ/EcaC family oxidoreductase [Mycolicibacterium sp. MU0050]CAJ1585030.1 SgcJ/EcaC family oxidoreductase [Mycolicibacterium sp. MU0050]
MNTTDEQHIRDLIAATTELWIAHDMPGWGRHFTEDADFVSHAGQWWTSRHDNVEGHLDIPDSVVPQKRNYVQRVESIAEVAAGVALVHTRWDWPDHRSPGSEAQDRAGIISYVVVRRDDRWRIRAAHNTRIS